MRLFLTLLFLVYSYPSLANQPPEIVSFTVTPQNVAKGDTATIQWDIRNADHAYILNLGTVKAFTGTQTFRPKEDTILTLITENSLETTARSFEVRVKGNRGQTLFPPEEEFKAKRNYIAAAPSFIRVLDMIHYLLQDYLGFQVKESYNRYSKSANFLTARLEKTKTKLLPISADGKQRRIAYLVAVQERPQHEKNVFLTIDASIEYRRRSERTWQKEESAGFYSGSIIKLYKMIEEEL